MGKLLIDVLNLGKEGLVGFTEIGEQVSLKEVASTEKESSGKLSTSKKEECLTMLPEGAYVHFKELSPQESEYHIYQERK